VTYGDKPVLSERRAQSRRGVEGGGEVVAEGTPEQVAEEPRSYTGGYLLSKSVRAEPVEAPSSKKKRRASATMREREAAE
jgi:excinuclease ABC subunit A